MRKTIFFSLALLILAVSVTNFSYAALVVPASSTPANPDSTTIRSALTEFKSLSKSERKSRMKEARKEVKAFKKAKRAGDDPSTNTLLLVILAILLPPLAVYLHEGEINNRFWISLLLTLLFWIPGVIYALIVILGNE